MQFKKLNAQVIIAILLKEKISAAISWTLENLQNKQPLGTRVRELHAKIPNLLFKIQKKFIHLTFFPED